MTAASTKPRTLFEKIWDNHVVHHEEGRQTILYIDLHLVHEVTSPQAFENLRLTERGVRRSARPRWRAVRSGGASRGSPAIGCSAAYAVRRRSDRSGRTADHRRAAERARHFPTARRNRPWSRLERTRDLPDAGRRCPLTARRQRRSATRRACGGRPSGSAPHRAGFRAAFRVRCARP